MSYTHVSTVEKFTPTERVFVRCEMLRLFVVLLLKIETVKWVIHESNFSSESIDLVFFVDSWSSGYSVQALRRLPAVFYLLNFQRTMCSRFRIPEAVIYTPSTESMKVTLLLFLALILQFCHGYRLAIATTNDVLFDGELECRQLSTISNILRYIHWRSVQCCPCSCC